MADALQLSDDEDLFGESSALPNVAPVRIPAPAPVRTPAPAPARCASLVPSPARCATSLSLAPSEVGGPRLPGPAGALADDSGSPGDPQSQRGQRPAYFRKSTALVQLEAAVGSSEPRMTLQQVLDEACCRPRAPVQASLLLVLIKSIARDSGGAEDLGVVLADESAEMSGSLHPDALSEHPGALVVGTALALRQVTNISPPVVWLRSSIVAPHRCCASGALVASPPPFSALVHPSLLQAQPRREMPCGSHKTSSPYLLYACEYCMDALQGAIFTHSTPLASPAGPHSE